jgi:hypothetical protein
MSTPKRDDECHSVLVLAIQNLQVKRQETIKNSVMPTLWMFRQLNLHSLAVQINTYVLLNKAFFKKSTELIMIIIHLV